MKSILKKMIALATVAALSMTMLAGCGAKSVDNTAVVATVGDSEILLGTANFYARYQQAMVENMYESVLGEGMWKLEISEGVTYEDNMKESVMDALVQLYILEDHAAELNVSLSDEEMEKIEEAADKFDAANGDTEKSFVSGDKEIVKEVLRLMTISSKMSIAMVADVDTEVSDEEAAQKRVQYVRFDTVKKDDEGNSVEMTEEELAAVKKDAEDALEKAKANGNLEAYAEEAELDTSAYTFDANSTTPPEAVVKAADQLKEGEFAELVEAASGLYILQLTSEFDEEATEKQKETIVEERKSTMYNDTYEGWKNDTEVKIHEDVYAKISLPALKIKQKSK